MKTRSILAILTLILGMPAVSSCCNGSCCKDDRAKYIFLFIGDGMGMSNVAVAEYYLSNQAGKLGGEQLTMTTFPYFGSATTYSADNNVTCSSASGTAIACGEKTRNGMVGMNQDSVAIKSMAYELKEDGYKIGIITANMCSVTTLTIGGTFENNQANPAMVDIATYYSGALIHLRLASSVENQISRIGITKESPLQFGVYVYYNSSKGNPVDINAHSHMGNFQKDNWVASSLNDANFLAIASLKA